MNELTPIYLADSRTFCTYLYAECAKAGKTGLDQHDFIDRCKDSLPTTGPHTAHTDAGQTQWTISDPTRNFLAQGKLHSQFGRFEPGPQGRGTQTLQQAAKQMAKDHCNDFDPPADGSALPDAVQTQSGTIPADSLLMSVVDLPGDGYPDAAISAAPTFAPHAATHRLTWTQVAHTLRAAQDKIEFGAAVVLGAIVLYITKGALPPIEAPLTPSYSPFLGTAGHHYPGA